MANLFRKVLLFIVLAIVLIPVFFVFAIRFGDLSVTDGERILLGYDEKNSRFQINEYEVFELEGNDGPYIIDNKVYSVDSANNFQVSDLNAHDAYTVLVQNEDKDQFSFLLDQNASPPDSEYIMPDKLLAVSDIEGNFDGFYSFLLNNDVIDEHYNWTFDEGHLVLVGDFVDRGNNVLPVLWLIYDLEQQAEAAGGMIHFILGNHEIMNLHGNFKYAEHKYRKVAELIGGKDDLRENFKTLFASNSVLGEWLRSKNIIEKIGDYIFVHAGLSPEILPLNISLAEMNSLLRANIDKNLYHKPQENEKANFIMGRKGPYWYRGCVMNYKYYPRITSEQMDSVLNHYGSKHLVIGHSVVEDVSSRYNGGLIRIDVKHGQTKNSGETKGLLIEMGKQYKVDDLGNKSDLL